MPTVNHLIIALAEMGRGNLIGARDQLAQAEANWPDDLRNPGDFQASAETGELWVESAEDLIRLRDEVIMLINEVDHVKTSTEAQRP